MTPEIKNGAPIVDSEISALLKEALGDEKAQEIIQEFYELVELNIEKALKALDQKDYTLLGSICHKIKSEAGMIGGVALQEISNMIENLCADQSHQRVEDISGDFKQCCEDTLKGLKNIL